MIIYTWQQPPPNELLSLFSHCEPPPKAGAHGVSAANNRFLVNWNQKTRCHIGSHLHRLRYCSKQPSLVDAQQYPQVGIE